MQLQQLALGASLFLHFAVGALILLMTRASEAPEAFDPTEFVVVSAATPLVSQQQAPVIQPLESIKPPKNPPRVRPPETVQKSAPLPGEAPGSGSGTEAGIATSIGAGGEETFAPTPEWTLSKFPTVRKEVKAPYPPGAKARGVQGAVVLTLFIDRTGRLRQVQVKSSPDEELAQAAKNALLQFEFLPAKDSQGVAVDVQIEYTYRFRLSEAF